MEISSGQYGKMQHRSLQLLRAYAARHTRLIYFLVVVGLALIVAALFSLGIDLNNAGRGEKTIYALVFLIFGVCHAYAFTRNFKYYTVTSGLPDIVYTLALASLIFFAALFCFLATGVHPVILSLAAAGAFLLPAVVLFTWDYFNEMIPTGDHKSWTLPTHGSDQKMTIFLNSLQVRVQLKINWFDEIAKEFIVTVPGRIILGEMFYRFLKDKENQAVHVQLFDKEQKSFDWKFTLKKNIGNKMLDPGQTIIQNKISANDIIFAERILPGAN